MILPWQWYSIYKQVFGTEHGKQVIGDLMRRFRVHSTTYRQGDPTAMAYCEGQRSVILDILKHIQITDSEILTLKEDYDRHTRDNNDANRD